MSKTYLAITIGPIYKTMSQARKTRELWSASFSFSILMECLIDEFNKYGKLLSPSSNVKFPLHGAGIFPDRCYIELTQPLDDKQINSSKSDALKIFNSKTSYALQELDYFQIYVVQKEIFDNPIQTLNVILDGMELSNKYFGKKPFIIDSYWKKSDYFNKLYQKGFDASSDLPLIKIIKGKKHRIIRRFKSIPEIATTELEIKDSDKYWNALGLQFLNTENEEINFEEISLKNTGDQVEDKIIEVLKGSFNDEFKFRHKYFAIVQADGDNVGSLIKELEKSNGNIMDLSNALNEFVMVAAVELVKYGAFPIYMGGDDLLFFAPLTNENYESGILRFNEYFPPDKDDKYEVKGSNVFILITQLNILFKEKLSPIVKQYMKDKAVSLSFGLSIGYYKKPMNEILAESYDLLLHNAKMQPCKNYIALKLEKHSGQSFEFGFTQNTQLYYHFLNLCNSSNEKKETFLNSVMLKINNQKKIIIQIANDLEKLKCFFDENFNEAKHKDYQDFFKAVQHIIHETFIWFNYENDDQKISRIYSCLRFVQFLNAKDSHE